jgi:ATP-dependent Clp protease ATP-binding subunit ClpA
MGELEDGGGTRRCQGEEALCRPVTRTPSRGYFRLDRHPYRQNAADEITTMNLEQPLAERVIGQDHGPGRGQPSRPLMPGLKILKPTGVFMLVGPAGGQDGNRPALADLFYGGENVITINMSEYQEAHTVSSLKGSPPGYVGYGEGGVLTEAVRRRPYSVVLLDEVEKAHNDVMELFYQVFDKGTLEDGEGRRIDFKNTLIILTSNLGTDTIMKVCADDETKPGAEALAETLRPELRSISSRRLGRLVVPFILSPMTTCARSCALLVSRGGCWKTAIGFIYGDDVVEAMPAAAPRWTGARNTTIVPYPAAR